MLLAAMKLAVAAAYAALAEAQPGGNGVSYAIQYVVLTIGAAAIVAVACRRSKR